MRLVFINTLHGYKVPKSYLTSSYKKILLDLPAKEQLRIKNKNINLVFLNSSKIKEINSKFRNKNKETDILSFESTEPNVLGELVFCPPVIKKNAKQNKWALKYEYLYMLIHGVLHLLGYDHETEKDSLDMFKLQDKIFVKITKKHLEV